MSGRRPSSCGVSRSSVWYSLRSSKDDQRSGSRGDRRGVGCGAGICRRLVGAGHRVAVLDVDGESAERAAEELRAGGAEVVAAQVDVSAAPRCRRGAGRGAQQAGPDRNHGDQRGDCRFRPIG